MTNIKEQLYQFCHAYAQQRLSTARDAMAALQVSANEETKSSVGDKYETGRAMAQLEIEKLSTQIQEAQKLNEALQKIDFQNRVDKIQPGSLVITNQGIFFISISVGQITMNETQYFAIGPGSPIGTHLMGKKAGMSFDFNKKHYLIHEIW